MTLRALQRQLPIITLEEFLERESSSPDKHEFHAGLISGMAGGTDEHADAVLSIGAELRSLARGTNCRALGSEMGVWIDSKESMLYPDATVVCGKRQFHRANRRLLTNPKLIVEVLSPSTRDYDLGTKFGLYQGLASLEEYIAMEPGKVELHHWLKDAKGKWARKKYTSRGASVMVRALGKELKLADIYEGLA